MPFGREILGAENDQQLVGKRKFVSKKIFDSTNFPFDAFIFTEYDKTSTPILKMASGWSLYVGDDAIFAYYSPTGNGTVEVPVNQDIRLKAANGVLYQEVYLGGWSDVNKLSFGLLVGTAVLSMIGCRGMIHPDAGTSDLVEMIPNENFHVIDCETAGFPDQNGDTPDSTSNVAQDSSWSAFGTYSLGNAATGEGYLQYNDVVSLSNNVGFYSKKKIDEVRTGVTDTLTQILYYVDTNNWLQITIEYDSPNGRIACRLEEEVSAVTVQEVTTYIEASATDILGVHGIGAILDITNDEISIVFDSTISSESISTLTLSGASSANYVRIWVHQDADFGIPAAGEITTRDDDICFAWDDACDPDLFVQHYLSGLPWSTTYSYADQIIKAAPGGKIQLASETEYYAPVSGEPSVGTLHLIPEEDRPSSWVLSGGTATSFTDVDFSSYVPSGVKALLLKCYIQWDGDGAADISYFSLRKNGSTETDIDRLNLVAIQYTNLGSGTRMVVTNQQTIECDTNGVIEYKSGTNPTIGALYLNIQGYYI